MSLKPAKEVLNKDEIIDILKRNVALYKNEQEFVDYIVNLAMYLIDQHYAANVIERDITPIPQTPRALYEQSHSDVIDQSISAPTPIRGGESLRRTPLPLPSGPPRPPQPQQQQRPGSPPPGIAPGAGAPRTPMPLRPPAPPPQQPPQRMPPAPPAPRNAAPEPGEGSGRFRLAVPNDPPSRSSADVLRPSGIAPRSPMPVPPPPPTAPVPAQPPPPEEPSIRQERAPLLGTPLPKDPAGPSGPSRINVSSLGRTRVYNVVRQSNPSTEENTPCHICGSKIPVGQRQCPGCGHFL